MIPGVGQHSRNCWESSKIYWDSKLCNFRQPVLQLEITPKRSCREPMLFCSCYLHLTVFASRIIGTFLETFTSTIGRQMATQVAANAFGIGPLRAKGDSSSLQRKKRPKRVVLNFVSCLVLMAIGRVGLCYVSAGLFMDTRKTSFCSHAIELNSCYYNHL